MGKISGMQRYAEQFAQAKVEAAQRLLLHREYTLDVVASLCGFSGANYLCRVFKKETGQSPAQWRALTGRAAQARLCKLVQQ